MLGAVTNSEARNLEAISRAIDQHNLNCPFPASEVRMNPFEVERLGWEEIRGLPIVPDPNHVQPPLLAHYLRLDEQVVGLLLDDDGLDARLVPFCELAVPAATLSELPLAAATIRFENGSGQPLDLGGAMISLVDAAGNVATPTTSSPAAPTSGTLDDGGSAEGVYVFRMPQGTRDAITLTVDYAAGAPIVVFHGSVS